MNICIHNHICSDDAKNDTTGPSTVLEQCQWKTCQNFTMENMALYKSMKHELEKFMRTMKSGRQFWWSALVVPGLAVQQSYSSYSQIILEMLSGSLWVQNYVCEEHWNVLCLFVHIFSGSYHRRSRRHTRPCRDRLQRQGRTASSTWIFDIPLCSLSHSRK